MARRKISLDMSISDLVVLMSEGNPGALSVLMQLAKSDEGIIGTVLKMDDMNIRGCQVWVAYKDHCGEDLQRLIECVEKRDPDMVSTINSAGIEEQAVIRGASFER